MPTLSSFCPVLLCVQFSPKSPRLSGTASPHVTCPHVTCRAARRGCGPSRVSPAPMRSCWAPALSAVRSAWGPVPPAGPGPRREGWHLPPPPGHPARPGRTRGCESPPRSSGQQGGWGGWRDAVELPRLPTSCPLLGSSGQRRGGWGRGRRGAVWGRCPELKSFTCRTVTDAASHGPRDTPQGWTATACKPRVPGYRALPGPRTPEGPTAA